MPKQSASFAFCAFSQSERAVPVNPAHELACVGAGAVVDAAGGALVAADELVPVCDCANNGAAKINDVAHAIALSLQGFINPPFAKRIRCDARPTPIDISSRKAATGRARPHAEQPDECRCLARVDRRLASHPNGIELDTRCAVAIQ
jgi:hypothetical protein